LDGKQQKLRAISGINNTVQYTTNRFAGESLNDSHGFFHELPKSGSQI